MGNCPAGKFETNYIIYRNPVTCMGSKSENIPQCEHAKNCMVELGTEFGAHIAKTGKPYSKKAIAEYFRFKLMSEGKKCK